MGVWLGMRIGSRRVVLMPNELRKTAFWDKALASDGLKNDDDDRPLVVDAQTSRQVNHKNFILEIETDENKQSLSWKQISIRIAISTWEHLPPGHMKHQGYP